MILFPSFSSGQATITGRLLGPNGNLEWSVFSKDTTTHRQSGIEPAVNNLSTLPGDGRIIMQLQQKQQQHVLADSVNRGSSYHIVAKRQQKNATFQLGRGIEAKKFVSTSNASL